MTDGLWRQETQLFSSNAPNGRFGTWLSLYGDYAVVSAHQREKVFIYERDGSSWPQKITLNSPAASINFGTSVSVYQENLLVGARSEEHTSELQSRENLVCRLLLEKKKENKKKRRLTK